jgi:hypothetical protein
MFLVSCDNSRRHSRIVSQNEEEVIQQSEVVAKDTISQMKKEKVSEIYISQKSWIGTEVEAFLASNCTLDDDTIGWFFQPINLEKLEKEIETVHIQQGCKKILGDCISVECAKMYEDVVQQFIKKHPTYSFLDLRSSDWWGHDVPYDRLYVEFENVPQGERIPFPTICTRN